METVERKILVGIEIKLLISHVKKESDFFPCEKYSCSVEKEKHSTPPQFKNEIDKTR